MLSKTFTRLGSQFRLDPGIFNEIIGHLTDENAVVGLSAVGTAAFVVPTLWEQARRHWSRHRQNPALEPQEARERVRSIFADLADARNHAATDALDSALVDLLDRPHWGEFESHLNNEVAKWSQKREAGAANPPDQESIALALLSLIQKVRETGYKQTFADHHGQVASVDRAHRAPIGGVFVRLKAGDGHHGNDQDGEEGEYLDFRRLDAAGIESALRQVHHNLVILGGPGSGKSTLLQYLAAACAASQSENALLPVLLNLRDYADGQEPLIAESAAQSAEDKLQIQVPAGFFERALAEERCLVCLDGLDEVPSTDRSRVVARVERLARNHPRCVFIVSSRGAGYDDAPLDEAAFQRYTVEPMDDDGIKAFLDSRFGAGSEAARSVWDTVNSVPALKALVSNPLQLAMLNMVYREHAQDELPLKQAGFFQRMVDELIPDTRTAANSEYGRYKFYPHLQHLMTTVAHLLHQKRLESIGENDLRRAVASFLQNYERLEMGQDEARTEAGVFVEMAERRTGLLVGQRVRRSTEFRFLHASFREYLAARHIYLSHYTDGPETLWEEIEPHLSDVHWKEVIQYLLTGFADDEEEYCTYLAEKILAAADESMEGHEDFDDEALHEASLLSNYYEDLVAIALAGQAPMSDELQDRVVSQLMGKALSEYHKDYHAYWSLQAIKHIPEKIVPELTEIAVGSTFPDFDRVLAAREIAQQGATGRGIELLTGLATSQETETQARVFAARYLGDLGEVDTAISVLTGIGDSPSEETYVRGRAFGALWELDQAEVAREWLTRIVERPDSQVSDRLMAWRELGKFGESERARSVNRIAEIAEDTDVSAHVRMTAAHHLYSLGNEDAAIQIMATLALDPVASLELEDWWLRGWAELVPATLSRIARDRSVPDNDREWVVDALEDIRDVGGVIEIAADVSLESFIRVVAADSLRRLGFVESAWAAIDALNETARDHDARARHRYIAGSTLAALGETETAIAVLTAVADDAEGDEFNRTNAAEELATLGQRETALRVLDSISQDENVDPVARLRASDALVRQGEVDTAIASLAALAHDAEADEWDRESAAIQIGMLGEHAAAQSALRSIMGDRSMPELARRRASDALERLRQE